MLCLGCVLNKAAIFACSLFLGTCSLIIIHKWTVFLFGKIGVPSVDPTLLLDNLLLSYLGVFQGLSLYIVWQCSISSCSLIIDCLCYERDRHNWVWPTVFPILRSCSLNHDRWTLFLICAMAFFFSIRVHITISASRRHKFSLPFSHPYPRTRS